MSRRFAATAFTNDATKEGDYQRLRLIVDHVHDETFFGAQQRRRVWQAVHELLLSLDWKSKEKNTAKAQVFVNKDSPDILNI
jgi:hypothetical protein